jgi:hypothetical protein
MKYSLIMLVENIFDDTPDYIMELYDMFTTINESFEILIAANGTGSKLIDAIAALDIPEEKIKAFEFNARVSQAVCLKAMLKESRGEVLVVTESYQQITIKSLKDLLHAKERGGNVICPWRQNRVDNRFSQIQSNLFNSLMTFAGGSRFHDISCTVKVFHRDVLEDIALYGSMYKFLPILAQRKGYQIIEVPCEHLKQRGKSGIKRFLLYWNAIIDLIILYFNLFYSRKPLRFFSLVGVAFLLIGLMIMITVIIQKSFFGYQIGGRPSLLMSIFFIVLGTQVACVGLLGEIIAFIQGRHTKEYSVEMEI